MGGFFSSWLCQFSLLNFLLLELIFYACFFPRIFIFFFPPHIRFFFSQFSYPGIIVRFSPFPSPPNRLRRNSEKRKSHIKHHALHEYLIYFVNAVGFFSHLLYFPPPHRMWIGSFTIYCNFPDLVHARYVRDACISEPSSFEKGKKKWGQSQFIFIRPFSSPLFLPLFYCQNQTPLVKHHAIPSKCPHPPVVPKFLNHFFGFPDVVFFSLSLPPRKKVFQKKGGGFGRFL